MTDLKNNNVIEKPIYDFCVSTICKDIKKVFPAKIIIVEGILIFNDPRIRDLFDIKLYVDTDDDIRLLRRIERDTNERGRSFEGIKSQYLKTVYPMYQEFVIPQKRYADFIVPGGSDNSVVIDLIIAKLNSSINE